MYLTKTCNIQKNNSKNNVAKVIISAKSHPVAENTIETQCTSKRVQAKHSTTLFKRKIFDFSNDTVVYYSCCQLHR